MIAYLCRVHGRTSDPVLLSETPYCPDESCSLPVKLVESPALRAKHSQRSFAYRGKEMAQSNTKTHRRVACVSMLAIHCARCRRLIAPQTEFVGVAEGTAREDICRRCAGL